MLWFLLELVVAVAALPVLLAAAYLFALTLLSGRTAAPRACSRALRFDLVVPAHDEQGGIAQTVQSLLEVDWPADRRRVLVVADNCADDTARVAARAGAQVLARDDDERRGKGWALATAFARSLADGFADAVVVVDADTVVDPGLLAAFAARLERGALAVQADYAVRNPDAGWRTRLMSLAFTLFHRVRSLGRERLSLSCGLRGNGMCFAVALLREVPYAAFSLVEDVEYGLRLGEAGHRVWYADEARVSGEMVPSAAASASQRRRWEEGRRALRRRGWSLAWRALREGDRVLGDLAVDLLVPPLARLGALAALGCALAVGLSAITGGVPLAVLPWAASLALLVAYLARGWQLSGTGLAGLRTLAFAPVYLAWKVLLRLAAARPHGWVRTERQGEVR